jgi:hypothetical protein
VGKLLTKRTVNKSNKFETTITFDMIFETRTLEEAKMIVKKINDIAKDIKWLTRLKEDE